MKRRISTSQVKTNTRQKISTPQAEFDTSTCPHCRRLDPDWVGQPRIFHEECNSCSPADTTMSRFCPFWKHFRLEHLYKCCRPSETFDSVEFKNVQLCRHGGRCPGCRAVRRSTGHRRTQELQAEGSVNLYFDFDYRDKKSNHWVYLYAAGTLVKVFGDYRNSSLSDEVILREHHLNDSDWSGLREEVGCSDQPQVHGINGLKVIDVQERCIVVAPPACEYAALSYVWGTSEAARNSLKATSYNIKDLETPGSLNSQDVPATIEDAMTACEELGIRYLWVDRLCILQGQDNSAMINVMDQIYSGALVTIVAPANDDVLQGLPGISRNQILSFELRVPGWRFTAGPASERTHGPKWSDRGWTFQEDFFSKKLLFLRDGKAEVTRGTQDSKTFFQLVGNYSKRQLSYPDDKVRAFAGVLNHQFNGFHRYGMPFREFEHALLWEPTNPSKNERFPSWSWASVRSINYPSNYQKFLGMPIASWAFLTKGTASGIHLTPIASTSTDCIQDWFVPERHRRDDYAWVSRGLLTSFFLAWKEGCFDAPMLPDFEGRETWEQINRTVVSIGGYEHCWKITRPQNLHQEFTKVAAQAGDGDPNRRLLVHTQFAIFNLDQSKESCDRPGLFPLFGVDDTLSGWVILDRPSDVQDFSLTKSNGRRRVNVLALAVSQAVKDDAQVFEDLSGIRSWKEANADISYLDSDGEVSPWDPDSRPPLVMLNIMLVKEAELGQSYRRVGMGKVLLKRWKNGSPQFKVSILE